MKERAQQQRPRLDLPSLNAQLKDAATSGLPIAIEPFIEFIEANCRPFTQKAKLSGFDFADLFQIGALTFLSNAPNIKPDGNPLSFLGSHIRGVIMHTIRDEGSALRLPGSIIRNIGNASFAYSELQQELGRNPTAQEVSNRLGTPLHQTEELLRFLDRGGHLVPVNTENAQYGEGLSYGQVSAMQARFESPLDETVVSRLFNTEMVDKLMTVLTPREKKVVELHIIDMLPQSQVAQKVGCSQVHVSRILKSALTKMRELLQIDTILPTKPMEDAS